jgi:hypothetical protein
VSAVIAGRLAGSVLAFPLRILFISVLDMESSMGRYSAVVYPSMGSSHRGFVVYLPNTLLEGSVAGKLVCPVFTRTRPDRQFSLAN